MLLDLVVTRQENISLDVFKIILKTICFYCLFVFFRPQLTAMLSITHRGTGVAMTAGNNAQKRVLVCSVSMVFFDMQLLNKDYRQTTWLLGRQQAKRKESEKMGSFTGTQNRVLNNKEQSASLANREFNQENQQVSHANQ